MDSLAGHGKGLRVPSGCGPLTLLSIWAGALLRLIKLFLPSRVNFITLAIALKG